MQSTNYTKYLEGGHNGRGPNKNELKLKTSMQNCDPQKLATIVTATRSGLSCIILHLERKKVFGSCKRQLDLPLGLDNDSHRPNKVNFFVPKLDTRSN
jgi:hypothetical protein